jgi:hypothetical protein
METKEELVLRSTQESNGWSCILGNSESPAARQEEAAEGLHSMLKCQNMANQQPPWLGWQGESGFQSFDLDGVACHSLTQIPCFVDHFNKLE